MKAETWEKLNGTGWGDEPQRDDMELDIPAFMFETTQSVLVPAAAFEHRGKGRVKHMQHVKEKRVRDVVNGVFWFFVVVAVFALLINLGLLIC